MAEMMLCGACIAPGCFELVAAPVPQTAPDGWVLVDIAAAGLCGTDYHIFTGKQPYLSYPRVIGHELWVVWPWRPPAGPRACPW